MHKQHFPKLLSPLQIGNITLKNRMVSTGHETGMADDRGISDALIAYHEARAKGGAGLIVVEVALVDDAAVFVSNPIKVTTDACIERYQLLAKKVQAHGCRLFGQLFHPGRELLSSVDGTVPVSYAPSAVPNERFHVMPRAMTIAHIQRVIEGFGDGARRLQKAGLDGVELVASHGYLLSQFLNPRVNQRQDAYGGDVHGRLRLLREAIQNIRSKVGEDFVVGLRISADENSHDGLTAEEVSAACQLLDEEGQLDYYSFVVGSSSTLSGSIHIVPPMSTAAGYIAPYAAHVRQGLNKPVIATGRINHPQLAEDIIEAGQADACGMTRAMICDPELANKTHAQRAEDIRVCIGCNQACVGHFVMGFPVSCIQYPESGREAQFGIIEPTAHPRRVMVVGGGPAGMKAAAIAASRGHDVTLYEAAETLGGQAQLSRFLPARAGFAEIIDNLSREMTLAGVKVVTGTRVDPSFIEREAPDAVVLATGARPRRPKLPTTGTVEVVDAWQVLRDEVEIRGNVLIADWRADWIGIGVAEKLAIPGREIHLCINGYTPGQSIQQYARNAAIGRLHKLGIHWYPCLRPLGAEGNQVHMQHTLSGLIQRFENIDTLVLAMGHESVDELQKSLTDAVAEVHVIGDCLAPRTAEEAVFEGLKVGCVL